MFPQALSVPWQLGLISPGTNSSQVSCYHYSEFLKNLYRYAVLLIRTRIMRELLDPDPGGKKAQDKLYLPCTCPLPSLGFAKLPSPEQGFGAGLFWDGSGSW